MYNNFYDIEFLRSGRMMPTKALLRKRLRLDRMKANVRTLGDRARLAEKAAAAEAKEARQAAGMYLTRTEAQPMVSNDTIGRQGYNLHVRPKDLRFRLNYTGEKPKDPQVAEFVPVLNPLVTLSRPSAELFLGNMAAPPARRTLRLGDINGKKVWIPVAAGAVGLGAAGLAYLANNGLGAVDGMGTVGTYDNPIQLPGVTVTSTVDDTGTYDNPVLLPGVTVVGTRPSPAVSTLSSSPAVSVLSPRQNGATVVVDLQGQQWINVPLGQTDSISYDWDGFIPNVYRDGRNVYTYDPYSGGYNITEDPTYLSR